MQHQARYRRWSQLMILSGSVLVLGCERDKPQAQQEAGSALARTAEVPERPLEILIDVPELQARTEEGPLRVLDARPLFEYKQGHIPGAVSVDINDWKKQALSEGGLHDAKGWSHKVSTLGIDELSNVVVYATNPTDATRIWWTLKYLGVDNAAVLDGGWPQWVTDGGAESTETPDVQTTSFDPSFHPERLAQIGDVKASLGADQTAVVDTRSDEEFAGEGPGPRPGRIPGAVHLEWKELLDSKTGRFKSKSELRALFQEKGLTPEKGAITYCQTGGRASLDAFALELAGFPDVKNYYCSYQEWSSDPEAPVEQSE